MTVTKEALEAGMKYTEEAPKIWTHGVCAGVIFNKEGKETRHPKSGDICHYWVRPEEGGGYGRRADPNTTELICSATSEKRRANGSIDEEFMKYILHGNPLGQFVINRDDLSSIKHGAILIDAKDAGYERTLWLCKVFRYMVEETDRPRLWYNLVNRGVEPLMALIAASVYRESLIPSTYTTHCSVFDNPKKEDDLVEAYKKEHKPRDSGIYDAELCRNEYNVFYGNKIGWSVVSGNLFKAMDVRQEKVPDGWGGFTYKKIGGTIDDLAKFLIDLTAKVRK